MPGVLSEGQCQPLKVCQLSSHRMEGRAALMEQPMPPSPAFHAHPPFFHPSHPPSLFLPLSPSFPPLPLFSCPPSLPLRSGPEQPRNRRSSLSPGLFPTDEIAASPHGPQASRPKSSLGAKYHSSLLIPAHVWGVNSRPGAQWQRLCGLGFGGRVADLWPCLPGCGQHSPCSKLLARSSPLTP